MNKKNLTLIILFLIVVVGAFFRLYRINDFATFLGDQGRDAIIVKRIAMLEHFPAIGASMSLTAKNGSSVFLGPFYYYLLSPFQALSFNNPLGLAVGTALINSISIIFVFLIARVFVKPSAALLAATLTALSFSNISLSRFAWNPNILPFFSLVTLYFFIDSITKKRIWSFILFGAFCGMALQLHYIYLTFAPAYGAVILLLIAVKKLSWKQALKFGYSLAAFILVSSPLILFDLRHQFINSKAIISVLTSNTEVLGVSHHVGLFESLFLAYQTFLNFVFKVQIEYMIVEMLFVAIPALLFYIAYKKRSLPLFIITAIFTLSFCIISFYHGEKYIHYFTPFYYLFYIMVAAIFGFLTDHYRRIGMIVMVVFIGLYGYLNISHVDFLISHGDMQIARSEKVARSIASHLHTTNYSLTALPNQYSDSTYRYFLEVWGKRPSEKDMQVRTDELIVICEETCQPIGNGQWDIAYFAPAKIIESWKFERFTIYRLSH
ncbi:phospholipid carrier-dependent glycosyltransferase [Candidatus Roizmanbacteria bacterium]|nr:phospholipid carrier-dependent glycosyltransferase [Candidatus Roizmanbacteria bacterium]